MGRRGEAVVKFMGIHGRAPRDLAKIKTAKALIIVGPPGAGKSDLIKWLELIKIAVDARKAKSNLRAPRAGERIVTTSLKEICDQEEALVTGTSVCSSLSLIPGLDLESAEIEQESLIGRIVEEFVFCFRISALRELAENYPDRYIAIESQSSTIELFQKMFPNNLVIHLETCPRVREERLKKRYGEDPILETRLAVSLSTPPPQLEAITLKNNNRWQFCLNIIRCARLLFS